MEIEEAVRERLEVREYADGVVGDDVKRRVMDAGCLPPNGKTRSTGASCCWTGTGTRVAGADFAVVILTDTGRGFHEIDATRAVTHMQFVSFDRGVGPCISVGMDREVVDELLGAPEGYAVPVAMCLGYPVEEVRGERIRGPLD